MPRKSRSVRADIPFGSRILDNLPYFTLIGLLVAVFLLGGSSREDMRQLIILRPLTIVALAVGLVCLDRRVIAQHRGILFFALAVVLLVAVQLVPLPPALWQSLPGRGLATDVARLVGEDQSWRPISLVPWRTWNALYALAAPFGALLLMCELNEAQRYRIFLIVLLLVGATGALGLLQAMSPISPGLRFYTIFSEGVSTGLFANRNHQAAFLVAGVVAVIAYCEHFLPATVTRQLRRVIAAMIVLFLVMMILATGSRTGMLALFAAILLCSQLLARDPSATRVAGLKQWLRARWIETSAAVVVIAASLFFLLSRSPLLDRIFSDTEGEELRFQMWGPIVRMIGTYFPVGAGSGTFPDVYRVVESVALVRDSYVNHAHNDWIEPLLDGGLAAAILMVIAVYAIFRRSISLLRLPREGWIMARAGMIIIIVMAIASITDYPLRTPALACLSLIHI